MYSDSPKALGGLRSWFSLGFGLHSPASLVDWAAGHGLSALGILDHQNFYGLPAFIDAARQRGLKAVVGCTLGSPWDPEFWAVCTSRTGYGLLNRLLGDLALQEGWKVQTSGDDAGHPPAGAATRPTENARGQTAWLVDWFAKEGWGGLCLASPRQDILHSLAARRGGAGLALALVRSRPWAAGLALARDLGLPFVAFDRGTWQGEGEKSAYRLLRAIDRRCTLQTLPAVEEPGSEGALEDPRTFEAWFARRPDILGANQDFWLSQSADARDFFDGSTIFPPWKQQTAAEAHRELKRLCRQGLEKRYPPKDRKEALGRLDYELDIIRDKGFSSYFLVVKDIVDLAPRTCGRGSSASSMVAYLLEITHVDPLRHRLFFERFLNRERKDPPDIDVDFPWDEREGLLDRVFADFQGRAAMVAEHVSFSHASALRESALALGFGPEEVGRFSTLARSRRQDLLPPKLMAAAASILGLPRYIGMHPGGVVICPGPSWEYFHVQPGLAGRPVMAWEKDGAEDLGLVKIDLLGNRSLAVLRDGLALAGLPSEAGDQAIDDDAARGILQRGDSLGIFYVESPATRQLLAKMGQADYEHLVVASSIIRPAANRYINEYVRRLRGGQWQALHPRLEAVLDETLGIMVYQEDVSRVAMALAAFSAGEADALRKVLSRKDASLRLESWRQRFFQGAAGQGVESSVIDRIWDMILSFDGYSFCKSHSASYARLSYRLAWLRAWYPLEFFCAVINNGGGFYTTQTYVNQVKRLGFSVRGPDVRLSRLASTCQGGVLQLGLGFIRDLHRQDCLDILDQQDAGGWQDAADFFRRNPLPHPRLRCLIRSGALDGLAGDQGRAGLFWIARQCRRPPGSGSGRPRYPTPGGSVLPGAGGFQVSPGPGLVPGTKAVTASPPRRRPVQVQGELFAPQLPPVVLERASPSRLVQDELHFNGILFTRHPLEVLASRVRSLVRDRHLSPLVDSRNLADRVTCQVWIPGLLVCAKEVRTRQSKDMAFLSFEDPWGIFETVWFPEVWETFRPDFESLQAFLLHGRVMAEWGAISLEIDTLLALNRRYLL